MVSVPVGTLVKEAETGRIIADISSDEPVVIAKGGNGGWGNQHFATSTRQIPRFAKSGALGEELDVTLELKLLADVGLIGFPNVGKSTIINSIVGEKVSITSPKPQTTRNNLRAVVTESDYQMIFIDTPGIHTPKNKLGEYMVTSASSTFSEVDVIVMVCDATDKSLSQIDAKIIEKLK